MSGLQVDDNHNYYANFQGADPNENFLKSMCVDLVFILQDR